MTDKRKSRSHKRPGAYLIYGRHAVTAALANPARTCRKLYGTDRGLDRLAGAAKARPGLEIANIAPHELEQRLGGDVPHQGLALEVASLAAAELEDAAKLVPDGRNLVIVLDQVTDPHNVGAIMRSAVAFGARALVTQTRHSPPESGALAKAASGALDALPWVRATNLARALEDLAEIGYWRIGLEGGAGTALSQIDLGQNIALVLGAEGRGLREKTRNTVDALAHIPILAGGSVDSLNVSNAAAVALYEFVRR